MNKRELTACVASKMGMTRVASAKVIDAVFQTIREGLENNRSTLLHEFGSFTIINRARRMGVNPATKQPMAIPAHKAIKFNPSKKITLK